MPRAPKEEVINRVRIHAETTVTAMGPLLVRLTMMGLENIGYELVTDVKGFGRREHGTSGADVLIEYIKEHPTFQINDVVQHFRAQGRDGSGAYGAATKLVHDGILKKLGSGNYASADVKHIEGPNGSAPPKEVKPNKRGKPKKKFDVTSDDAVWHYVKNRKGFTTKELVALFRSQGRAPASVHPTLHGLKQRRMVKALGDGNYQVLKKKIKAPKKAPKKAPAHKPSELNGPQPAQETNHG